MRAMRAALHGALGRIAGPRGVNATAAGRVRAPADGAEEAPRAAAGLAASDTTGDDLLDRERQLRVLMSSWM